jgi:hypothetical protein
MGWAPLDDEIKKGLEEALKKHEEANPQPIIKTLDGEPAGEGYRPRTQSVGQSGMNTNNEVHPVNE